MSKWRKSTRRGNQGNCVEWRKSSRSANQGDCVEWRKSNRSGDAGNCVELGSSAGVYLVRDSKLGDSSPIFDLDASDFGSLLDNLKRRLTTQR